MQARKKAGERNRSSEAGLAVVEVQVMVSQRKQRKGCLSRRRLAEEQEVVAVACIAVVAFAVVAACKLAVASSVASELVLPSE